MPVMCLFAKKRVSRIAIHRKMTLQAALRWLAVILWMGLIFFVSAIPSIGTPLEPVYDFTFKKLAHATEYGILTALVFNAVRIHIRYKGRALRTAVLIAILYAVSDEWHQTFVPGREGTLRDVAIDAVSAVGVSIWLRSRSKGFHRRGRKIRQEEDKRVFRASPNRSDYRQ
jgi:VanZ family protein